METAIAYCRVSDVRQVTDGNSLITQEKQARDFAKKLGYNFDRLFAELGESAKTENRPVLKEMLEYCHKNRGKIQVLIIPKIDRFSRNRDDYGALKLILKRLGIRLESVGEPIEDTPVGRFTESMLASVAQFDNEIRAERCKGGMVESVRAGRWVWKAPKGFKNVRINGKGTIAPDEISGPLVVKAFDLIADGSTAKSTAAWLTENGVPITDSGLHDMVHNIVYIGMIHAFGIQVQGSPPFTALVTLSQFFRAQEALRRKSEIVRGYDYNNPNFPLRGTILCECRRPYTGCWAQGAASRFAYYRCMTCKCVNLPRNDVETAFRNELDTFKMLPADKERLLESIRRKVEDKNETLRASADRADGEIERIKQQQSTLAAKTVEGVIPDDVAKEQFGKLSRRLADAEAKRGQVVMSDEVIEEIVRYGLDFLNGMGSWWLRESIENKKSLQSWLYASGVVYSRNGNIRTSDYPLLERIKQVTHGGVSSVVDQDPDFYEHFVSFMSGLYLRFGN